MLKPMRQILKNKPYTNIGDITYQTGGFRGREEKSASEGKRETCACLKLSVRHVSGERLADLLNNSDPVRVKQAGNLRWDS